MSSPHSPSQHFADRLVAWRWPLLAAAAVLTAAAWLPSRRLEFDRSVENMFAADDPLLEPYRQLKRTFGGNEVVIAAYQDDGLLTETGLARVATLTRQLGEVEGVAHIGGRPAVMSLSRFPLGMGLGDERLLELASGFFISRDGRTAAAVVLLDSTAGSQVHERAVREIRAIVERHDPGGVIAGEPVMVAEGFRLLEEDGRRLGLICTALLTVTLVLCFRSLRWVIIPIAVVNVTLILTQGLLVVSGLKLSMVSSMLWAIVTVIGVAAVIHIVVHFREQRDLGRARPEALAGAFTLLLWPILWTCLTDSAGFGALLAARVGPVQDFGVMMMCGAVLVLVVTMLILPGLTLWGSWDADPKRPWGEWLAEGALAKSLRWVLLRPKLLLTATAVVATPIMIGAYRLQVETDFTSNFRDSSGIVQAYGLVESNLGGAGVWDVILSAPAQLDAEYLDRLRRLEGRLRREVLVADDSGQETAGLTKTLSLADILDAGPQTEIADRPLMAVAWEFFRRRVQMDLSWPEDWQALLTTASDGEVRLKLEVIRRALPDVYALLYGQDPQAPGRFCARIMLRSLERQPAEQKQRLIEQVRQIVYSEFPTGPDGERGEVTGFFVLLANLIESMIRDQWVTFGVACGIVLIMLLVALRSPWLAVAAIVLNSLPVMLLFGAMGWLDIKINMGSAMIAAVTMGLAVDSSIHYLVAYRRLRTSGLSVREALDQVHRNVGMAAALSTLSLVVGFSALCFSEFVPLIYFGVLVSLAMLGGAAINLSLLPAVVFLAEKASVESDTTLPERPS